MLVTRLASPSLAVARAKPSERITLRCFLPAVLVQASADAVGLATRAALFEQIQEDPLGLIALPGRLSANASCSRTMTANPRANNLDHQTR